LKIDDVLSGAGGVEDDRRAGDVVEVTAPIGDLISVVVDPPVAAARAGRLVVRVGHRLRELVLEDRDEQAHPGGVWFAGGVA